MAEYSKVRRHKRHIDGAVASQNNENDFDDITPNASKQVSNIIQPTEKLPNYGDAKHHQEDFPVRVKHDVPMPELPEKYDRPVYNCGINYNKYWKNWREPKLEDDRPHLLFVPSKRVDMPLGNTKLGKDTLVLNMNPATDCPSRVKGLCPIAKYCYALTHNENVYGAHGQIPAFRRSGYLYEVLSAKEIADDIETAIAKAAKSGDKKHHGIVKYVRFSEAGDFKNQEDVDKMSRIADLLKGKVVVYGYTKRKDLNLFHKSDNMIINGSGFMVDNNFVAVKEIPPSAVYKCAGDCRNCTLCKTKGEKTIFVKLH